MPAKKARITLKKLCRYSKKLYSVTLQFTTLLCSSNAITNSISCLQKNLFNDLPKFITSRNTCHLCMSTWTRKVNLYCQLHLQSIHFYYATTGAVYLLFFFSWHNISPHILPCVKSLGYRRLNLINICIIAFFFSLTCLITKLFWRVILMMVHKIPLKISIKPVIPLHIFTKRDDYQTPVGGWLVVAKTVVIVFFCQNQNIQTRMQSNKSYLG